MKAIDSDSTLHCQACRNDILSHEDKVILGAKLSGFQRYFIFHPACYQISKHHILTSLTILRSPLPPPQT